MATPTPVFPAGIATDAQLKIANNLVKTSLKVGAVATDTILFVNSTAGFIPNCLVSIDKEIIAVASIAAGPNPSLIVASGGRGFDGTTAAQHSPGAQVSMFIDAWHHNALAGEVKAIEAALGPNLQNVASAWQVLSTQYIFPPQQPGGTLVPGNNAITLTPMPSGVNGSDVGHYLWITGGTGASEPVLIVGGSGVAGAPSGQLIIQAANAHSGAWTIQSATAGIQEAIETMPATGGQVIVPPGTYPLNANVSYAGKTGVSIAISPGVTFTGSGSLPAADLVARNTISYTYIGPAAVVMRHDMMDGWSVTKPDGSRLDTTGTTTSGLQEAINWGTGNGYPLEVYGGWLRAPVGKPHLFCSTSVNIPALHLWSARFHACNIYFTNPGNVDGFVFDSVDMFDWDMGNGQIFYQGTGAAIRFNPVTDNGESVIAITSSIFRFSVIALGIASGSTQQGTGVRFTMTNTPGAGFGSGMIVNNRFEFGEINGGNVGIQVDDPQSPNYFASNHIFAHSIHTQVEGVKVGVSAAAADKIFGNYWNLVVSETGTGMEIWGGHSANGGDIYDLSVTTNLILQSSAVNNLIRRAVQYTQPITNNATTNTNRLWRPGPPVRSVITPTSGTAIANRTLMPCVYIVSGGTVSAISISADGGTFDNTGEITGAFYVPAGGYISIAFSVAPTVTQIYG